MSFDEAIRNVCNDTIEWNIEACEIVCQEAGLKSEFDSAGDDFEKVVFLAIEKLGYTYGEY